MSDDAPKSAYEIALEKLKRRDRERGESAPAALTGGQKKTIAELRKLYEARLAEREILHRSERVKFLSHPEGAEKLEKLEEEYVKDRRRIEEQRDRAIEAARAASGTAGEQQGRGRAGGPFAPRGKGRGPKAKILLAALGLGLLAPAHAAAAPAGAAGVAKEAAKPVFLQGDATAREYERQILQESIPHRTVRAVAAARIALLHGFTTIRDLGTKGADYCPTLTVMNQVAAPRAREGRDVGGFVMTGGVIGKHDFGGD